MTERIRSGCGGAPEASGELSCIRERLAAATAGGGGVVYVEGAPGCGKTELVAAAAEAARASGMLVLEGRGHTLERDFPFGLAIQLFEETWLAASLRERTSLLEGPARPATEVLSGAFPAGRELKGDRGYAIIHGLFSLARALTADETGAVTGRALTLIVDDIDCADALSLRFLAYLARRAGQLPIALVVAARPAPSSADPQALSTLRSVSELLVLAPADPPPIAVASAAPTWSLLEREAGGGPRAVAAEMAMRKSLAGGHRESVTDLAELAWGDGALLDSGENAGAWPVVAASLLFVDELERALEIAQAAIRLGHTDDPSDAGVYGRGWSLYHQARITEAVDVANAALTVHADGQAARGLLAACRLAQGRLDQADAALSIVPNYEGIAGIDISILLDVRAQLRLVQLRPADGLSDALEAGRLSSGSWGSLGPGVVAWRSTAALARLALGETERARALAEEELELARERGLTRVIMRDLRVLAFAAKGTRRLDLLEEAVRAGRAAPARLEHVIALVELGAATRRANQRTAARQPLRRGLELAERGGAVALARRAREELGATGARSRRVILTGIDALTPSERRVADLAAGGLTTRQIAQVLFVTSKTVEFHLRHVYRKLDIPSSRADLARALSQATSG